MTTTVTNKPQRFLQYLQQPADILPLVVFRIIFGLLMLGSTVRFVWKGWVHELYIAPEFHFTYWGFSWVRPLPGVGMYVVFGVLIVTSLLIVLGWRYRVSMAIFFLTFTYVELIDKAYYLNHYYFVSLLSFLLIFLPLNRAFSVDAWQGSQIRLQTVPRWTIVLIQCQLAIVYVFAGIAKLNPDWLFAAQPLKIWLRSNTDFPVIGSLFVTTWFPFAMSWAGAFYDLTIVFWLSWRRTRLLAYAAVVVFHVMTAMLFRIGVFPWVMIGCTLIFFSAKELRTFLRYFGLRQQFVEHQTSPLPDHAPRLLLAMLAIFIVVQAIVPLRHWAYPGNTNWTQEGFRFSWRVMLVESAGMATFYVYDPATDQRWLVHPRQHLTAFQETQMAFQPDMILEFAHFLEEDFAQRGYRDVEVRAEVYVRYNGRSSRLLIDETVDLTTYHRSLHPQKWILSSE